MSFDKSERIFDKAVPKFPRALKTFNWNYFSVNIPQYRYQNFVRRNFYLESFLVILVTKESFLIQNFTKIFPLNQSNFLMIFVGFFVLFFIRISRFFINLFLNFLIINFISPRYQLGQRVLINVSLSWRWTAFDDSRAVSYELQVLECNATRRDTGSSFAQRRVWTRVAFFRLSAYTESRQLFD